MKCAYVQIRCKLCAAFAVADAITAREFHSELYLVSGPFDLLLKVYLRDDKEIDQYINDNLLNIDGIERVLTWLTVKSTYYR